MIAVNVVSNDNTVLNIWQHKKSVLNKISENEKGGQFKRREGK